MPVGKQAYVGVWEGGQFIGAVLFGRGSNPQIGTPFGLSQNQIAELVRVALASHAAPASKIVTIAMRLVRRRMPGLRALVSYADTARDHHGGIYQAMNWHYLGLVKSHPQFFHDGRWKHFREITGGAFGQARAVADHRALPSRPSALKHKYAIGFDDEMRALLASMRKPYPKRAGKGSIVGPTDEEGGSIPTPALQEDADSPHE